MGDIKILRDLVLPLLTTSVLIPVGQVVRADVFENPTNLQVLASDITPDELRRTMLGFSGALNAKCSYCHTVDDDLKLPNPDFSSDEKPTKRVAREMLRMLGDINERVSGIDAIDTSNRVEVTCTTCHRGQYRPVLILTVLEEARSAGGIDAVITKYAELRDQYFGNHTYDLRPSTLAGFATSVASDGDLKGSIRLLNYANENFPNEERVLFALARTHKQAGNFDEAIYFLRQLVTLYPESSFYAKQLELAEQDSIGQ